jgi:hypothetical protein
VAGLCLDRRCHAQRPSRVGATAGALNISVSDVEGEALLLSLPEFALSTGSACTSASMAPSYVLRALGLSDALAHSSLRVSLGRFHHRRAIWPVCRAPAGGRAAPAPRRGLSDFARRFSDLSRYLQGAARG